MLMFLLALFVYIIITGYLPVRKAVTLETIPKDKGQYYICRQKVTSAPNWVIVEDSTGFYKEEDYQYVFIEGVDPDDVLDRSIRQDSSSNRYVIYGEIVSEKEYWEGEGDMYPVITSTGFDILAPIERGNSIRPFDPKEYLTLLDFKLTELPKLIFKLK